MDQNSIGIVDSGPRGNGGTYSSSSRRTILAVGAASSLVALAGCLGMSDDDDDDEEAPGDQAEAEIAAAVEELTANADRLAELTDDDEEADEEDVTTLSDRLDSAAAELEDAADLASDDEADNVSALQDVEAFQRRLVTYHEYSLSFQESLEAAGASWSDGDLSGAVAEYDEALDVVGDVEDHMDTVISAHEAIDSDHIQEASISYDDEVWEYVPADGWFSFESAIAMTNGLKQYASAFEALIAGENAFVDDEFDDALSHFETAIDAAQTSLNRFEDVLALEGIDGDTQDQASNLSTDVSTFLDALDLFTEAAELGQDGFFEDANATYQAALEALP